MTQDNLTIRARLLLLVLGSLLFISGAIAPLAISVNEGKSSEFRSRLEKLGGGSVTVYEHQKQATDDASATMGGAAMLLLGFTLACGLYAARGIVRRLTELTEAAERMRDGDLDTPVHIAAETELDQLAIALDRMRFDLKQVVALSLQRTDLEKDIAVASTVQTFFLPKHEQLETEHIAVNAFYRPASRCGGDWWWVHELGDQVLILLGDVTGHGTGPAMITASVTSAFHMLLAQGLGHDPARLLAEVNEVLREICREQFFVTLCAILVNPQTCSVKLWNAGAPPVLTMSAEGQVEALAAAGNRLGETVLKLGYVEATLAPGSRVLAFTDGVPELAQPDGKTLGLRRLRKVLNETRSEPVSAARTKLVSLLDATAAGAPLEDDMTFVLIDLLKPVQKRVA